MMSVMIVRIRLACNDCIDYDCMISMMISVMIDIVYDYWLSGLIVIVDDDQYDDDDLMIDYYDWLLLIVIVLMLVTMMIVYQYQYDCDDLWPVIIACYCVMMIDDACIVVIARLSVDYQWWLYIVLIVITPDCIRSDR